MGGVKRYPYLIRRTDLIWLSLSISLHVLCAKRTKEEACCKGINASLNDSLQNKARGYMCPRINAEIHSYVESSDTSFSRRCQTYIILRWNATPKFYMMYRYFSREREKCIFLQIKYIGQSRIFVINRCDINLSDKVHLKT